MTDKALKNTEGLTDRQVEESRKIYGKNVIPKQKKQTFLNKFLLAFGDPIIKILIVALVVNILFSFRGHGWFETVGIALSIFLSSFVSTLSEHGSEKAFEKLQEEASRSKVRIKRAGQIYELYSEEIVRGDIVLLQAGDRIAADGVLLSGELRVDQSSVNGESHEYRKTPAPAPFCPETLAANTLFRGTVVTSGEGVMQVENVGESTVFGSLAASLAEVPRESPLKTRLSELAKTLSRIGYCAAATIALADLLTAIFFKNGMDMNLIKADIMNIPLMIENILHALTLAISIIIMAVPEGLPMMITVVLSRNMFKMLRDKVMVRKLSGIETAGSMNILFTDKTGTLTTGKPSVSRLIWYDGEGDKGAVPEPIARTLALSGHLNTSSKASKGKALGGNSTDRVLMQLTFDIMPSVTVPERSEHIPFDSDKKYSAAKAGGTVYVKGAPDILLARCTHYRNAGGDIRALPSPQKLLSRVELEGQQGRRVLCICTAKQMPEQSLPALCFECLAVISDPTRPNAAREVKKLRQAGIQVVMVTGDSKSTATAIAAECGILTSGNQTVITGEQLKSLSDRRLMALLPSLAVVARALPGDKTRLVKISQQAGMVCAMTGDGINDAPALRCADVGFAMGSGTEVAQEAGDIIITDDNIASIYRAALYGRTILRSIKRFILFQLTVNFCAVGISLIGPFIGIDTPVTVAQILWINLIMDTLGGLAFAGEPPLEEYMQKPPTPHSSPLLSNPIKAQIACVAVYTVLLYTFFLLAPPVRMLFVTEAELLTGFFALFIFSGIAIAFSARTERANFLFALRQNKSFIFIMSAVICVQLFLIYFGGDMFRTCGLSLTQLAALAVMSASVAVFDSIRKILRRLTGYGKIEKDKSRYLRAPERAQ